MKFLLLSFFAFQAMSVPDVPNFYPTLPSAMAAARSGQKEIVIFFGKASCGHCTTAWQAYEKDTKSTSVFVSTRLDTEDFDGNLIFEKYDLKEVPAWVILKPNMQVKEKWSGGWKNASGQPTELVADQSLSSTKQPSTPVKTPQPDTQKNKPTSSLPTSIATQPQGTSSKPIDQENPASITSSTPESGNAPMEGFVLQAGYFGSSANAQKLISDLHAKGWDDYVSRTVQQNGATFYRVISKTFSTEAEAQTEKQRLAVAGITANVKKTQDLK